MSYQPTAGDGNPQGKGVVPLLDTLSMLSRWQAEAKSPEQILREFCLSTLVLSSAFQFRVVPGRCYYLYRVEEQWQLSLISPEEWGARQPGDYVARCEIGGDMTWSLDLSPSLSEKPDLIAALEQHLSQLLARIAEAEHFEDALPHYEAQLPYQQRVMASAMASSLQTSLLLAGLRARPGRHWLESASLRGLLSPAD